MNLNTFPRHGVFEVPGMCEIVAARLRNADEVARARVFPYQLLTAYANCISQVPSIVRDALQDAMELAVANVPVIEGKVFVCPDVSGSMKSPVTGYRRGYADIQQRVHRGHVDTPKTTRSVRIAALPDGLLASIIRWRAMSIDTSDGVWVFPSERGATPLSKDNCWRRHFLPKLSPVGLDWANFQVMRRTHNSLSKELNVDPQIWAEQMGHGVDVNENVYTITSINRRREAVNVLETAISA